MICTVFTLYHINGILTF